MGRRGPPPKPTELHVLHGTFRKDRHSTDISPEPGQPSLPESLSKDEREIWELMCREIESIGLLYKIDGWQIERYAKFFCRWRQCEAFIAENGISYLAESGWKEYPELKESHRLDKALKQIELVFGLQPSARSRITKPSVAPAKPKSRKPA